MSFKGEYNWIQSKRQGGRKAISFTLTCMNFFQSETFNAAIIDGSGQIQPMIFHQQTLAAKKSFRFDYDTVGWDWCQGDIFAILDKHEQMVQKWLLNLRVPAPGECSECHGTHKCASCNGTGIMTDRRTHTISTCEICHGTGICQTCYIPIRRSDFGMNQQYDFMQGATRNNYPNVSRTRERKIAAIQQRIGELQAKIAKCDWDEKMMQLRDADITLHNTYSSQLNLKYQYQRQLHELQYQLQQLEGMQY